MSFKRKQQAPETIVENYKIGKVMGKGAFGKVNLAIHRLSGKFVALKSINKQFMNEEASKRKVMQEFNILRRTFGQANKIMFYKDGSLFRRNIFRLQLQSFRFWK